MRYLKDSFSEINPRGRFWESQFASHRRHLLVPFHMNKMFYDYEPRYYTNNVLLVDGKNWLWQGIEKYIPYKHNITDKVHGFLFLGGVLIASIIHHFESRLWKEKKWDKESGCSIPLRRPAMIRAWNWLVEIKLKPILYYIGLFIEDQDLDTNLDLSHITQGRKYRRFLVMQYCRKMRYNLRRDNRYDFLEISPSYKRD